MRVTATSETLIDVVRLSNNITAKESSTVELSDITDHNLVFCVVVLEHKDIDMLIHLLLEIRVALI